MTLVTRRDRQFDVGALLLIVVGVAIYLLAAARLRSISQYTFKQPGPPGALDAADRARYASYAGVVIVGLGCCVGAAAAGRHLLRR